jgi:hypothetical protein
MTASAAFADLEGLLDLAHGNGADMCASLLRALTDLYLQRPVHTPEDEHYYTELALRLIDATEVSDRAALAARLASYPSAPRPVLERLARDIIEVAGPILEHSACPSSGKLKAIAEARGGAQPEIIATPPRGAPPAVRTLGPVDAAEASELLELFYRAKAPERRLILINLEYAPFIPWQPLSAMQGPDVWRLESAALQHDTETLIGEFERTLGVSRTQARRIIDDELGEPTVVAAKAMNLPADVVQRLLLSLNPRVGRSADRVRELAQLYGEISMDAAGRLIALWRGAELGQNRTTRHEPVAWWTAAQNARRLCPRCRAVRSFNHDARLRGGEG